MSNGVIVYLDSRNQKKEEPIVESIDFNIKDIGSLSLVHADLNTLNHHGWNPDSAWVTQRIYGDPIPLCKLVEVGKSASFFLEI